MKRTVGCMLIMLLALSSLAGAATLEGATISVASRGVVTVEPDEAVVSLGVAASAAEAKSAQEKCVP